jgi:hypothetical protein
MNWLVLLLTRCLTLYIMIIYGGLLIGHTVTLLLR